MPRYYRSFPLLLFFLIAPRVCLGEDVIVTSRQPFPYRGRIAEIGEENVVLDVAGIRVTIPRGDIVRITRDGRPYSLETGGFERPTMTPSPTEAITFTPLPTSTRPAMTATATMIPSTPSPAPERKATELPPVLPTMTQAIVAPVPRTASDTPENLDVVFPFPGREPLIPLLIPSGRFRTITGRMVRLREGPGQESQRIGSLDENEIVLELDEHEEWLQVKTREGTVGWVFAELTELVRTVPILITGDRVALRDAPGLQRGNTIRQLELGDVLVRLSRQGEWIHVRDLEGRFGWVASDYVRDVTDERILRQPVVELTRTAAETVLQGVHVRWYPAGSGRKQMRIQTSDSKLVRGGHLVLLAIRDVPRLAGEIPTPLFHSPDITWQQRFDATRQLEDLGLSIALVESTEDVVVCYLRGKLENDLWVFQTEVDVSQIGPSRLGIVVQKGLVRGGCAVFQRQAP